MPLRAILKGLVFIASLLAIAYLLRLTGLDTLLNETWIDRDIRGQGLTGSLIFLGIGAVSTALGFPRQAIAFLGGYAYGLLEGTALAVVAALLGCILAFYYARFLGRGLIAGKFPSRVRKLDDFLSEHPFSMALLIRLLPVGSNLLTNLAAGVASVRAAPFMLGSAVGYLPQTIVFALAGSGVHLNPTLRISAAIALFVVSALLGVYLYRKLRHGKSFDEEVDASLGNGQ